MLVRGRKPTNGIEWYLDAAEDGKSRKPSVVLAASVVLGGTQQESTNVFGDCMTEPAIRGSFFVDTTAFEPNAAEADGFTAF